MMFCDLQYVEGSMAVVGKLDYADWLLVFCSFFVYDTEKSGKYSKITLGLVGAGPAPYYFCYPARSG